MKLGKWAAIGFFITIMVLAAGIGYKEYSKELAANANGVGNKNSNYRPQETSPPNPSSLRQFDARALKPDAQDIIIGRLDAPVRIVEYASFSCPHCAKFHTDTLPALKESHINKGKAVLILRHFPLNAPAMKAAMAVACAKKEERAEMAAHLFATQKDWAFDRNYLANIAAIAEMFDVNIDALEKCFSDIKLENTILSSRQRAEQKLQVASTPSFFINGKRLTDAANISSLRTAIDAALKQ